MGIFQKLLQFLKKDKYPHRLYVRGRQKLPTSSFKDTDKLYRAFTREELEDDENIGLNAIKSTDISCNWSRFSKPEDLRYRKNAKDGEGCYSFTVVTSRYNNSANPVHYPIPDNDPYPNYSHVEVRQLYEGEDILFEPPRGRKKKYPAKRLEYRKNLLNCLKIEIPAT